jgi:hypothetical protein
MVLWNVMPNNVVVRYQPTGLHGVAYNGTITIISMLNAGCILVKLESTTMSRTVTVHHKGTDVTGTFSPLYKRNNVS